MNQLENIFGAGFRSHHYLNWKNFENISVIEILSDNFMYLNGGSALHKMLEILERVNCKIMHGVALNIASPLKLDKEYCLLLKKLMDKIKPQYISDHLCFSASDSHNSFDLLPFPYTKKMLNIIVDKVNALQDIMQKQFCFENISSYVEFKQSEFTEFEFLNELCKKTGCGILLDVNNLYVCSFNHKFDAINELSKLDSKNINYYHLAGHSIEEDYLFDTHDQKVCDEVWKLMKISFNQIGRRPVIIERDDDNSMFSEILNEIEIGNNILCSTTSN